MTSSKHRIRPCRRSVSAVLLLLVLVLTQMQGCSDQSAYYSTDEIAVSKHDVKDHKFKMWFALKSGAFPKSTAAYYREGDRRVDIFIFPQASESSGSKLACQIGGNGELEVEIPYEANVPLEVYLNGEQSLGNFVIAPGQD